jgi:hypothetical protein
MLRKPKAENLLFCKRSRIKNPVTFVTGFFDYMRNCIKLKLQLQQQAELFKPDRSACSL